MTPELLVRSPEGRSQVLEIRRDEAILGRDPGSDLVLQSPTVSEHHARFRWDGRQLFVTDMGSTNGTSRNGERVVDWIDLSDGDVVTFGVVDATVRLPNAPMDRRATLGEAVQGGWGGHVFISYASQDLDVARALVVALEREGVRCWMAERDVPGGSDFASQIVRAIETCRSVLVLVTPASNHSPNVRREIERAMSLHKTVVPLRLDGAVVDDALAFFFAGSQWRDLSAAVSAPEVREVARILTGGVSGLDERPPPPLESVLSGGVPTFDIRIRHPFATAALICASSFVLAPLGFAIALLYLLVPDRPEPGRFVAWWAFWVGGIITAGVVGALLSCASNDVCLIPPGWLG